MDPFYTRTGPRPDLAAIEFNAPEGYIGHKIIPTVEVADKSGVIYYSQIRADAVAQTARVAGVAPTPTQIATANTTYTAAEIIERGAITPDEAKQMGGIEKADLIGAKFAKRNVLNAIEKIIADLILARGAAATANFDPAKVLTQVQDGLQAVRRYEGRTTLVASTKTLKAMIQGLLGDATQGKVLSRIVNGTAPVVATEGLHFQAWVNAVAMYFGVDQVMAGDDAIWNAAGVDGRFAVGKFDTGEDVLSHKWLPVYAKNFMFLPNAGNPWQVESIGDRITKNNLYDASVWCNVVVLNAGAKYVFDGV